MLVSILQTLASQDIQKQADVPVGPSMQFAIASADDSKVYVSGASDSTVYVVDAGTNSVVKSIALSFSPWKMYLSPDGARLFVLSSTSHLAVIDAASDSVTSSIAFEGSSAQLAFSSGDSAVVFVAGSSYPSNSLVEINVVTGQVTRSLAIPFVPGYNDHIAVSEDGQRLFITSTSLSDFSGTLNVIDISSFSIEAQIPTGGKLPWDLARAGGKCYVANFFSGSISVYDGNSMQVYSTGGSPFDLAFNSSTIFSLSDGDDMCTMYSASDMSYISAVSLPGIRRLYNGMCVSPNGKLVAAGASDSRMVYLVDSSTASAKSIAIDGDVRYPVFNHKGDRLYLPNVTTGNLMVFSVTGGGFEQPIPPDPEPAPEMTLEDALGAMIDFLKSADLSSLSKKMKQDVGEALKFLDGCNKGRNGADEKLEGGQRKAAISKIEKAIRLLRNLVGSIGGLEEKLDLLEEASK